MGLNWRWVAVFAVLIGCYPVNWYAMRTEWGIYKNDPAHEWSAGADARTGPDVLLRSLSLLCSPVTLPVNLLIEAAERSCGAARPTPAPPKCCPGDCPLADAPPAAVTDPEPPEVDLPGLFIIPLGPREPELEEAPPWRPPGLSPETWPEPLDPEDLPRPGRAT